MILIPQRRQGKRNRGKSAGRGAKRGRMSAARPPARCLRSYWRAGAARV